MKDLRLLAVIAAVMASAIWGTGGVLAHSMSDYGFDAWEMGFIKSLICVVITFVITALFYRDAFKIARPMIIVAVAFGVIKIAADFAGIESSLSLPVGLASALQNLGPIFTIVAAVLIFKDRISKFQLIAAAMTILGCFLIKSDSIEGDVTLYGVAIALGAALLFSLANVGTKYMINGNVKPIVVLMYVNLFATVINLFLIDPSHTADVLINVEGAALSTLYSGVVMTFVPLVLTAWALTQLDVTTMSVIGTLEIAFSSLMGMAFLGEPLMVAGVAGIVIILLASAVANGEDIKERMAARKTGET